MFKISESASNQRSDVYGGSLQNFCRFPLEVARKVADAIGADKTGMRFSPYGEFNDMIVFDDVDATFAYLAGELGKMQIAYIHIIDQSFMGAPKLPESALASIRAAFGGTLIFNGGLDKEKGEILLSHGQADLIAFGRAFLANPDLVHRLQHDLVLNDPDEETFYTPGEKGYTDYPTAGA